jgi:hypothetical protein
MSIDDDYFIRKPHGSIALESIIATMTMVSRTDNTYNHLGLFMTVGIG